MHEDQVQNAPAEQNSPRKVKNALLDPPRQSNQTSPHGGKKQDAVDDDVEEGEVVEDVRYAVFSFGFP